MGSRYQVPSKERPQGKRIKPIGLDLRISNQSRLERMSQDHFFHGVTLNESYW